MKIQTSFLAVAVLFSVALSGSAFARTANQILAKPDQNFEKPVVVDVAFLRPVRWKSPIPEVAFFHAMTYDRRAKSFGGEILLAAPESERDALVRRYGVAREGNPRDIATKPLRATLRNTGEDRRRGIWFLDQTDGALNEALLKARPKIEALDKREGDRGGFGGRPGQGPRRNLFR